MIDFSLVSRLGRDTPFEMTAFRTEKKKIVIKYLLFHRSII